MQRIAFTVVTILALAGVLGSISPALATPDRISHQDLIRAINGAKGKVVVVSFWASWCGPCRREIPELIKLRDDYPQNNLEIIGVALDFNQGMLDKFMSKMSFNYPVYWGSQDVSAVFSITSIPKTVIYDRNGEKVLNHDGYMPPSEMKQRIDALLRR